MSWFPRVGSLSRFSPFSGTPKASPASPAARVTDDDFSYITSEDIQAHEQQQANSRSSDNSLHKTTSHGNHHGERTSRTSLGVPGSGDRARSTSRNRSHSRVRHPELESERATRPKRDTDVIHFRHKGSVYSVHFAAYAIDEYTTTVGSARDFAAKRIDADPRRVRMFWRGRNLKDDAVPLRELGMRSADKTDIMVVVGERTDSDEDSEGSDGASEDVDGATSSRTAGGKKKRKGRRGGKKAKKGGDNSGSASPAYSGPAGGGAEHLPMPSGSHPLHRPSNLAPPTTQAPRQPSPQPATPMGKLQALEDKFKIEFLPLAESFVRDPPREKEKRDYEHKKVSETILAQVLLKLDGVETEGDAEARAKRKGLVKEVQGWLNRCDEVVKL